MRETASYAWEVLKTPLRFKEITAPTGATIPDNTLALYAKDKSGTSALYYMNDAGVEVDLSLAAGAALTRVDDTNVTLTLGGTPATALLQAVSLTLGWSGQLAAARGGTGVAALSNVTAGSSKITLGGTPTGAVIQAFSIDVNQANLDHGSIGGLGDDDHTIYALLAGRNGGQTLIGGTAASNKLVLQSTSNATRGDIDLDGADLTFVSAMRARMASQNRFRFLQSMVRVTKSASQTGLTPGVWTTCTFDQEDFDTDGLHDNVTNNSRLTAAIAGKYLVIGNLLIDDTNVGGTRQTVGIRIIKNGGTTTVYGDTTATRNVDVPGGVLTAPTLISLAAGDYVELQGIAISSSNAGTFDFTVALGINNFQMTYIGE